MFQHLGDCSNPVPILAAEGMELIAEIGRRERGHANFYRRLGSDGFPKPLVDEAIEQLTRTVVRIDEALSDGRSYLLGEKPTLADFMVLPNIVRMEDIELAHAWRDLPSFVRWYERLQARRSFRTVFDVAGVRLQEMMRVGSRHV